MLNFTTSEAAGVLIIAFEPTAENNYDWQSTQREWLYKLIESREDSRFAIDLSEVTYLASSEIGFLVTIKRRIDRRKGKVVFFGMSPSLLEIFQMTNLTGSWRSSTPGPRHWRSSRRDGPCSRSGLTRYPSLLVILAASSNSAPVFLNLPQLPSR